jgi:basic amino acid/polyamine antiporter, APA family
MTPQLVRSLSLTQLVLYGVGTIVGAGIYTIIGSAAGLAGAALWLSMLLAGVAAFLTALSYAELVGMYPRAGAEYQFLKAAFPKWPMLAFLAGFVIALNAMATSATVSLAFAGYFRVFLDWPAPLVALALLTVCTVVNIAGLRQATWVSITMIVVEVGGLVLLVVFGLVNGDAAHAITLPRFGDAPGIFAATALVFFVYIGFEDVANFAEEARQPRRDVPRAILISVLVTSAIYLLVIWAVFANLPPAKLAQSDSPLTTVGLQIAPWLGHTLAVTALFATASTALIALVSISRLLFGMARDGSLPKVLARTTAGRRAPWVAALVLYAGACLLLPLGEVGTIASISALGILLVFVTVHAAVIGLRFSAPAHDRPFRSPWRLGRVPLLPPLGMAISLALITQFKPVVYAVVLGGLALGVVVYGAGRLARGRSR